jgi:hypothetical protein
VQEDSTWIGMREFARVYGRTKAWSWYNAASGNLLDFGITTLQVERTGSGKPNSRSWYFLVPNVVLEEQDETSNPPVVPSAPKP